MNTNLTTALSIVILSIYLIFGTGHGSVLFNLHFQRQMALKLIRNFKNRLFLLKLEFDVELQLHTEKN